MTSERKDYRSLRRAFVAACEAAKVDTIARLNPARGPQGELLFMDSAALGPRLGTKAVLAVATDADACNLLTGLLAAGIKPPPDARLVLVHAFDPAALAGVASDPAWPPAMLQAVATEDLSKVTRLTVVDLGGGNHAPLLSAVLPKARIDLVAEARGQGARSIRDALAAL
jgi:hypothetical protein